MTIAEAAAENYRARARHIRALAEQEVARGRPLTARKYRFRALIAEHAAEAEVAENARYVP